jgi:hypothetical protein
LDDPHTVKASVEQQQLHADTQSDQARKQGAHHMIHGLLGLHATHGQGIAAFTPG